MKQTSSQPLIPKKAHFIFDPIQAYAACSLSKIQYQQHNPFLQLTQPLDNQKIQQPKKVIQLGDSLPKVQKIPSPKNQITTQAIQIQDTNRAQTSQQDTQFKDWNVNYLEDIAKRVLCNHIHADSNIELLDKVRLMQKQPPRERTRRHKTKFKIPKTLQNQQELQNIVCEFINKNNKLMNEEVVHIKEYEKTVPFFLQTIDFAERLIAEKMQLIKRRIILQQIYIKNLVLMKRTQEKQFGFGGGNLEANVEERKLVIQESCFITPTHKIIIKVLKSEQFLTQFEEFQELPFRFEYNQGVR